MNKAPFNVITLGKRIGREITNIETYRQTGRQKKKRLRDKQAKDRQTERQTD